MVINDQKPRQTLNRFLRNGSERLDDDELSDLFTLKKRDSLIDFYVINFEG